MVTLGKWKDQPLTISIKHNSATISLEKKSNTSVFSFDRECRLWTAMLENISYRRGLNGNIVAKWNSGKEILHRRWLADTEKSALLSDAHDLISLLVDDLAKGKINLTLKLSPADIEFLTDISKFSLDHYQANEKKYFEVYKPVGILPPDQYISVVLQVTEGCSFNTCTFCNFYRDRPFKIKSEDEFNVHLAKVNEFIGRGISLRRTIFLGDANALVVPMRMLVPRLEMIHKDFDVENLGGIFAFLDGFSGEKKSRKDFEILKGLGLEKVYIGMESGHDPLLKFLNKPGSVRDVIHSVKTIKSAGVSVGMIVLLGAGGLEYADHHVQDTVQAINQLELGVEDLIYFSELIESEGLEYTTNAYQQNLTPMSPIQREEQGKQIMDKLVFNSFESPHISRYDIRDFVY